MTIYYVDVTTGSDGDDGLSEGNAFQTLEKAANTHATDDTIYAKSSASYVVEDTTGGGTNSIMQIQTVGTYDGPVDIRLLLATELLLV